MAVIRSGEDDLVCEELTSLQRQGGGSISCQDKRLLYDSQPAGRPAGYISTHLQTLRQARQHRVKEALYHRRAGSVSWFLDSGQLVRMRARRNDDVRLL